MTELRVPKLNANDDAYVLSGWLVPDGAEVRAGDPVVELETSKAVEEIAATADGRLCQAVAAGGSVSPGQLIAHLGADGDRPPPAAPAPEPGRPLVTDPARARMAELGIDEESVRATGLAVVRTADVDALAAALAAAANGAAPTGATVVLSRPQRAVGRIVQRSHQTIPAAYAVVKVDVGAALARARDLTRQVRRPVGLTELVVVGVAALRERFPLAFGRLDDDGAAVHLADAAHVGVTLDLGAGLYIPVLRDVATRTLAEVAQTLMEMRLAAAEGTFRAADLDGANIVVTLHTDADVVLAVPFVLPGHVCALALTAAQAEVVLDAEGRPAARTVVHIGLAYDHRVLNGRDAALFLDALRRELA